MTVQPPSALPVSSLRRTCPQAQARRPARLCRLRTVRRSFRRESAAGANVAKVRKSLESIVRRIETFSITGAGLSALNVLTEQSASFHPALRPARIPAKVSHGRRDLIPPQPLQSILRKHGEKHGRDT